jgi:hypothetical protein
MAERAVFEADIVQDAIVDIEHAYTTTLEVDGKEVPVSELERIGDVKRFAVAIREYCIIDGDDCPV